MAKTSTRPRRKSSFYMPSAFDLFTPSKEIVMRNLWIFGPLYAIPFIFWIHSWIWSPLPNQHKHWWYHADGFSAAWPGGPVPTFPTFLVVGFSILWLVIILGVGTIAQVMSQAAQLEGAQAKRLDFADLWKVVKELGWRMFGLYTAMFVIIAVGLILLIVPGLIFIRRYFLAPYVMLDKKTSIRESLDESAALSAINTGSIWGILGVSLLIGLVNIIPVFGGLVAFILGGLYSVAPALRYLQLKKMS